MFRDLKNEVIMDTGKKRWLCDWFVWNFKKNRNCNKNLLQDLEYVKKEFVKYINKN